MTTDTQALALEQALREVECDAPYPDMLPRVHSPTCKCHGTGSVPWLKGVRVGCAWLEQARRLKNFPLSLHPKDCEDCQGRGWVPSLDLATWHDAVLALPGVRRISYEQDDVSIYDGWSIKPMASANAAGLHGLLLALKEMKA